MISESFSLGDTAVHKLGDLWRAGGLESPNFAMFPCLEFTEVHIVIDAANGGNVAVSMNPDIDIAGKEYLYLLTATSPPIIIRTHRNSQRIYLDDIYVAASAATQTFHVMGLP